MEVTERVLQCMCVSIYGTLVNKVLTLVWRRRKLPFCVPCSMISKTALTELVRRGWSDAGCKRSTRICSSQRHRRSKNSCRHPWNSISEIATFEKVITRTLRNRRDSKKRTKRNQSQRSSESCLLISRHTGGNGWSRAQHGMSRSEWIVKTWIASTRESKSAMSLIVIFKAYRSFKAQ